MQQHDDDGGARFFELAPQCGKDLDALLTRAINGWLAWCEAHPLICDALFSGAPPPSERIERLERLRGQRPARRRSRLR